jgi:hypothetical protein
MNHANAHTAQQISPGYSDRISSNDDFRRGPGQPIANSAIHRKDTALLLPLRKDEWRKAVHEDVRIAAV